MLLIRLELPAVTVTPRVVKNALPFYGTRLPVTLENEKDTVTPKGKIVAETKILPRDPHTETPEMFTETLRDS